MIGGTVVETIALDDRVWINCRDKYKSTSAIYVTRTDKSRCVCAGDVVWWQGRRAFWTPQCNSSKRKSDRKCGKDYDIQLERIGYSGVKRPVVDDRAPTKSKGAGK